MDHHSTTKEPVHREDGTLAKINNLKRLLSRHLFAVREQREKHPDSPSYAITEKDVNLLYDQFQAIREEGERIDYNTFTIAMEKIDELLKKLRIPVQFRRTDILNDLNEILQGLEQTIRDKTKK
jgi:hypothetical protein